MELLRQLAELRSPLPDAIALAVRLIASPAAIMIFIAWICYNRRRDDAMCAGISFSLTWLLCEAMKIIIRLPRPWIIDPSFSPARAGFAVQATYAFPGVHAACMAALAGCGIFRHKRTAFRIAMCVLIAASAFSEMYLGESLPQAAAAGVILGIAIAALTAFFWKKYLLPGREYGVFAFLMTGLAAVLIFLALALEINETIDAQNAAACYEAAGSAIGFALGSYISRNSVFGKAKTLRKVCRFMLGLIGTLFMDYLLVLFDSSLPCPARILISAVRTFWIFGIVPVILTRPRPPLSGKDKVPGNPAQ